jgi:hypothetical protein
MFEPSPIDTGIEEAAAYRAKQSKTATPAADGFPNPGEVEQQSSLGSDQSGSSTPALDFLDDFFKADKRHLVAIKKGRSKPEIRAQHFDAADRGAASLHHQKRQRRL